MARLRKSSGELTRKRPEEELTCTVGAVSFTEKRFTLAR